MKNTLKAAKNWQTTLVGWALGFLTILQGNGWKIPETRQEWLSVIGGFLLGVFGTLAKDGAIGSSP